MLYGQLWLDAQDVSAGVGDMDIVGVARGVNVMD